MITNYHHSTSNHQMSNIISSIISSSYFKYLSVAVGGYTALTIITKLLFRKKPTQLPPPDPSILRMIDTLDHKFTIFDLISPKTDAFDKPFGICEFIKKAPHDQPIKLIICTKGGELSSCEKILRQLLAHPAGYIAYIRNECFSAGSILALGATEIVMKEDSYLGKIDPQMSNGFTGGYPVIVFHDLQPEHIGPDNISNVKIAEQLLNHMEKILNMLKVTDDARNNIRQEMLYSKLPHSTTFDLKECQNMGLNVRQPKEDELKYFSDTVTK